MGRNKTQKFADNDSRFNVIQPGKEIYEKVKGHWNDTYFKNSNDISLELACGRGEYTVGLAKEFSGKNFIGVDLKGARIWKGSGQAIEQELDNVGFLRTHIQNLETYFENQEVSEIWIIHPDPRPKKSDAHRRLTHPRFLDMYKRLLKPSGLLRLKTDNTDLYEYSLEVVKERGDIKDLMYTDDLYNSPMLAEHFGIKTRYEEEFHAEGHKIKYLKFMFT